MTPSHCVVDVDVAPEFEGDVDPAAIEEAVQQTLAVAGVHQVPARTAAVSVRVTGDVEMQALNRTYRNVDRPTDVLSFAFAESGESVLPPDSPQQLGDVIIDIQYARRQAEELQHSLAMEIAWLIIHGTLQILGYRHATEAEAVEMEALESKALRALGFRKG